jgi:hypothetical protein
VPQNGERNEKFGVYKTVCCGAEIFINPGSIFPDCPNHQKLTTNWKPVLEEKVEPAATQKSDSADGAIHIKNRCLFDLASGRLKLERWEEDHLHGCHACQAVLYVFVSQTSFSIEDSPPTAA